LYEERKQTDYYILNNQEYSNITLSIILAYQGPSKELSKGDLCASEASTNALNKKIDLNNSPYGRVTRLLAHPSAQQTAHIKHVCPEF
jgi:hypothetical protein